MVNLLRHRIK